MKANFIAVMMILFLILSGCTNSTSTPQSPKIESNLQFLVSQEDQLIRSVGSPYEVTVNNCMGARDSVKTEHRSKSYRTELDLAVSKTVAAEFGGDVKVAELKLSDEIGISLGIQIGTTTEAASSVQITTPPGNRTVTHLQWEEVWTSGTISVSRPDGTLVDVLPFSVLNSLTLTQLDSQIEICPDTTVESGATVQATVPTPTNLDLASMPSGDINMAGSSTVYPLSEKMVEKFKDEGFNGKVSLEAIGSGNGFVKFCEGATDISNSSRYIKEDEIANCQSIGREPIGFLVGTDLIAVVVNKDNEFINNLTFDELKLAFSTAQSWSDIKSSLPQQPIQRFSPNSDSGAFDFFVEVVFGNGNQASLLNASNLVVGNSHDVLAQGMQSNPYAIGYMPYTSYLNNRDTLNLVAIDGVVPSQEKAENGIYPISRPLLIYTTANIMKEKPQVAFFMDFYLTHVGEEISGIGYTPLTEFSLNQSRQTWLNAMK